MRIRFEFSKDQEARFISHLDMIRVFERSVRRAGLPLTYSQGFNPHPKIAFGPALAIGTASDREYVDISFDNQIKVEEAVAGLGNRLPAGFGILRGTEVPQGAESLNALINRARYEIKCPLKREISSEELQAICSELLAKEQIIISKRTKKGVRDRDIRRGIFYLECCKENSRAIILCELLLAPEGSVRPEDVVDVLISLGMPGGDACQEVRRTGLYQCQGRTCVDPMQVLA